MAKARRFVSLGRLVRQQAVSNALYVFVLAQPLNLAAMSDLRSGVQSQSQEVLHLPGVFLNCFLKETSQEDGRNKN